MHLDRRLSRFGYWCEEEQVPGGVEIIVVGWYQTKGSMGRTEPIARKVRWYVSVQLLAANGMRV